MENRKGRKKNKQNGYHIVSFLQLFLSVCLLESNAFISNLLLPPVKFPQWKAHKEGGGNHKSYQSEALHSFCVVCLDCCVPVEFCLLVCRATMTVKNASWLAPVGQNPSLQKHLDHPDKRAPQSKGLILSLLTKNTEIKQVILISKANK